jgi:DNA modification methylase
MHYTQGFSPALVRAFLNGRLETGQAEPGQPVLDPFSGSGTTVIECACRNVAAIGIEASSALAFLTNARWTDPSPRLPELGDDPSWTALADRLHQPAHRAALMFAISRTHRADGRPLKDSKPLLDVLHEVIELIRADSETPLPRENKVLCADARNMEQVADGSVGSILTSPPYLCRHDYARITRPYAQAYDRWYLARRPSDQPPVSSGRKASDLQVRAHPRATLSTVNSQAIQNHAVVRECCDGLRLSDHARQANVAEAYFADMFQVMEECYRALRTGAPFWLVIGGSRVEGAYIPTDLILAEFAESIGFDVEQYHLARYVSQSGRKLGSLKEVRPREAAIMMRKS